jgi:ubiquinone/menaquinone biosynthesis C-methylase UbiE
MWIERTREAAWMTAQSARFIGSIPENYDVGLGPHIFTGYAADIARRTAALAPSSVLELAAGTGIVTRELRDVLGVDCELLASDLNGPMLEVAKAKFAADELVAFQEVDATHLGFADGTFDVIVCQFGVMFFPDRDRSYAEAVRVLKPGGSYLFNVWDSWAENAFGQIAHEAVEARFPHDPPGFYRVPFSYHDADEIQAALRGAGFANVAVERVPLTSRISTPAKFAQGIVFGNPLYEEIIARGGDPQKVHESVVAAIEQRLGSQMQLQALVFQATTA